MLEFHFCNCNETLFRLESYHKTKRMSTRDVTREDFTSLTLVVLGLCPHG